MPFALLPSFSRFAKIYREIFICTDQSFSSAPGLSLGVFGPAEFSLSFLPEEVYIRGLSRDLLMCCNFESRMDYIVNPLTRNWIALPPPLPHNRFHGSITGMTCLVCDHPDEDDDCGSRKVILATDYKYKVVRILNVHGSDLDLELQVFSSESGRWNCSIVSPGKQWVLWHSTPAVCNGNAHWLTRDHGILTCDLSSKKMNNDDQDFPFAALRFIRRPTDGAHKLNASSFLGVFRGCLRTCNVIDLPTTPKLRVWELVDYASGDWKLEFEVYMNEMTPQVNSSDSGNLQERLKRLRMLHLQSMLHPHLGNIVYLWLDPFLFCCNLQSKTFEECCWNGQIGMLPYVLPRWPSPVPKPFPVRLLPAQTQVAGPNSQGRRLRHIRQRWCECMMEIYPF